MASAFYKDKLLKMVEIVKECTDRKISEIKETYIKKGKDIDLIATISTL